VIVIVSKISRLSIHIFVNYLLVLTLYFKGKTSVEEIATKKKPSKEWPIDKITHDVRDYLPLLHKQRKTEDPALIRIHNLRTLRRISKKL